MEYSMRKLDKKLLYDKVISNVESDVKSSTIGGASVLVMQNGEVLLDERRGYANVETKRPIFRDSLFRLASMTKPISAVAALIAEEKGYFSLKDPISRYFPEFLDMKVGRLEEGRVVPDHKPRLEPKLIDFLNHTSGFMSNSPLFIPQHQAIPKSEFSDNERIVSYALKNTCLTFDPCEATGYGAYLPFDLIAVLIQRRSGKSFSDFVKENILDPLGIKDITYHPTSEQWGRLVTMCERKNDTEMVNVELGEHTFESFPLSYTCAGAGLIGSIGDYAVFAEMLRRGGEYGGVRILSEQSVNRLRSVCVDPRIIGKGATTSWGISVRVILDGYPFLTPGSYGWSGAYGTHFFIDPENEITAIYMKNTRWYDSHGGGVTGRHFESDVFLSLT